MIPESKQTAVKNALKLAFGVDSYDSIRPITTGLSNALTFRIVVKDKPYLMKIARTDELSAPAVYFTYMQAGADAGIAPHVWYLSTEDKISITDFIEGRPFPIDKAREIMPKLISTLMLYASKTVAIRVESNGTNFRDFHNRMWAGEIDLSKDENKLQYALVHMNKFLSNVNNERFEKSLNIISK